MDKFELLHKYNTLVRRELAPPLLCSRDGFDLTVRLNDGETPVLKCYMCGSKTYLSDRSYEEIEDIVRTRLK